MTTTTPPTAIVTTSTTTPNSTTTTTSAATTVTAMTTSTGNWWDSQGTPQYGGTLTANDSIDPGLWDPNGGSILSTLEFVYMDSLWGTNWTTTPSVQNYQLSYWDEAYTTGICYRTGSLPPRVYGNARAPGNLLAKSAAGKWSRIQC